MKLLAKIFSICSLLTLPFNPCFSQGVTTPREASPAALVSQTIGISTITIKYSRPSVKGRKIWGELVSFGWNVQAFGTGNSAPWRAGANENTTITFSHDTRVEGTPVPAGTYGLFFVINQDNSGEVILSKNYRSWGSFFYDKADDKMRAPIKIRDNNFVELLTYDVINLTKNSGEMVLNWEQKQFPVKIEFAVNEIVMANAKEELQGPLGFRADGFISAALYSFQNNIDLDQATKWVNEALAMEPTNFEAIRVKSRILVRNGNAAEADKLVSEGLQSASENEITNYGYQLLQALGLYDKAIKVLLVGTQRFPKSANAWDGLGEAYATKGDKENAIKCFKKALTLNPSDLTKANSEKYLKKFGVL
jgi:tetratricopeptide (TPR) repeat protein